MKEIRCDVCIVGGGTGGVAAAISLRESGLKVVLTEETDWLGGQLTSQMVPPDEHPWIESVGCTALYRQFRTLVRGRYKRSGRLTSHARRLRTLNPGGGWVSHLCFEPAIGEAVLREEMLQAESWDIDLLLFSSPVHVEIDGDKISTVEFLEKWSGVRTSVSARVFIDATETGELLPLAGAEYRLGAESKSETGEPHALVGAAEPDNCQGLTWCAAIGWDPEGDHTIDKPSQYDFWKEHRPPHWPGPLLSLKMVHVQKGETVDFPLFSDDWFNLFSYRQIIDPSIFINQTEPATVMNWPMNDYALGSILDVDAATKARHLESAKQLTLSMLYWLQTEHGYRGLRLRPDLSGTEDGLAKAPYIRESRRIKATHTVLEQDVASYTNPACSLAPPMRGSIGVGAYRIDLHPSTNGRPTIDTSTLPFEIPLGALIPERIENLLAGAKNIGVTHITNGCYRLHPIEWNIGEAAGLLAEEMVLSGLPAQSYWEKDELLSSFQSKCQQLGIETSWPTFRAL